MFWESNAGYNNSSPHIDDFLKKENVTLKELLNEEDILQEYKSQNKNLTQYLHRADIIEELVELIVTEPPTDIPDAIRFKHSNVACEILTAEIPTMIERLVEREDILQKLYAFLEQEPPLNPLLSSFFSKTFGMLIARKTEQDWFSYQCVCLQVLEFIKTRNGFLDSIYKHIGTPAIMDLLFHIITDLDGNDLKSALFEWLRDQELIRRLIDILGNDNDSSKHNNVAQFICDLITTGRQQRQNELQEHGIIDSTKLSSDMLIRSLESNDTTQHLIDIILSEPAKESTIVSGIKVILKLLENPIINEPVSDTALQFLIDSETDHHKIVVRNILQLIAPRIKDFQNLLTNPPAKSDILTTVTLLSPPFGITRMQICTLLTVLIETEDPLIIQSLCETDFFNTLLKLFKQYCWNNILHNQVQRCITYAFASFDQTEGSQILIPSALQKHIIVNCKIVSKLTDCWMHNNSDKRSDGKKNCRLGYMGHLINMFDTLVSSCLASEEFCALVESSIIDSDDNDDVDAKNLQENWKRITEPDTGELAIELKIQKSFLAGIDPVQSSSFLSDNSLSLQPKDFQDEFPDYSNEIESDMQNSIDDLNQSQLFEKACNIRSLGWNKSCEFDIQFNSDDDIWDDIGGTDDITGDNNDTEQMQIFNQWDVQKDMNAINETGWATFTIDNFGDFDQHFNAAFDTTATTAAAATSSLSSVQQSIVTYSSPILTNSSSIGTIGDQMPRNNIVVNGDVDENGGGNYNNHCTNNDDLFGDFECHQIPTQSQSTNNLFNVIGVNGFDFDPFMDENILIENNNAEVTTHMDNGIMNKETENLNLINSIIDATTTTTTTAATTNRNNIIGAADNDNIDIIEQLQQMVVNNDEDDKPPPLVPSIENDDDKNNDEQKKDVLPVAVQDVGEFDNESSSAIIPMSDADKLTEQFNDLIISSNELTSTTTTNTTINSSNLHLETNGPA